MKGYCYNGQSSLYIWLVLSKSTLGSFSATQHPPRSSPVFVGYKFVRKGRVQVEIGTEFFPPQSTVIQCHDDRVRGISFPAYLADTAA